MGLRTASFESNAFVGHRFDQDIPIAETVRGYTSDIDSIRWLSCLNFRCKRFMMSFKLATYVTSACLPAGHGNVCVSLRRDHRVKIYLSCTVHAMQSKPTPLLRHFRIVTAFF